ncbi:hypothetical protein DL96DRAFT_1624361 [Flagelloscypha sp. PMI_526]|nr:hypothetical protein DL96DRAFT_1624361 [Flagelloscypha sp. PMI_526]
MQALPSRVSIELGSLPEDLLILIVSQCSVEAVLALRQCSKNIKEITYNRTVWLTIMTRLIKEWDTAPEQFQLFDPDTTSHILELFATARYRLFKRMGKADSQLLLPRSVSVITASTSWRAASFAQGGQWLGAIQGRTLCVYHVRRNTISTNSGLELRIILEEDLPMLQTDTYVRFFWDISGISGHLLEIEESGGTLGCDRHWLFHVHISHDAFTVQLFGKFDGSTSAQTITHGVNQPVLCTSFERDVSILWSGEGKSSRLNPLTDDDDVMHYGGMGGILTICKNDRTGIAVWQIPNAIPGESKNLHMKNIANFNWYDQLSETNVSELVLIRTSSSTRSWVRSGTGDFVSSFIIVAQYKDPKSLSGQRTKFFHKNLVARLENGEVVSCALEDVRQHVIDYKVLPMAALPQFVKLEATNDHSFIWYSDETDDYDIGDPWKLVLYGWMDGEKDRGAVLSFGDWESRIFHPDHIYLCLFSGRGATFTGRSLIVFDWVS